MKMTDEKPAFLPPLDTTVPLDSIWRRNEPAVPCRYCGGTFRSTSAYAVHLMQECTAFHGAR